MHEHLIPLEPSSLVTVDPDAPIVIGFDGRRVIASMDPARARRLASLIGLMTTSPTRPVDRTVLDVDQDELAEWMRAFVDLLSAAVFATNPVVSRSRLQILPVHWDRTPTAPGLRGEEVVGPRPLSPRAGPPTDANVVLLETVWSQSVEDSL